MPKEIAIIKTEHQKLKYCEETIGLHTDLAMGYITLAKRLHAIREARLYEPQWSSFMEFGMEMKDITFSQISRLCGIYQKYVVDFKIPEEKVASVGWTILARTLPILKTRQQALDFIESPLSRSDLEKQIKEMKTGVDMSNCRHKKNYYVLRICRDCGDKEKTEEVGNDNETR